MEIIVDKENKLVEVWVSSAENSMPDTEAKLKLIYAEYSKINYKTVVFRSGSADLSKCIEALIKSNMMKFAREDMNKTKQKINGT